MATESLRIKLATLVNVVLLVGGLVVAVKATPGANWDIPDIAIILVLAVASELHSVEFPSKRVHVSATFLGTMLAAVLLGGAPAALISVITVAAGWRPSRERPYYFLSNLVTFLWFPLLSGILFHSFAVSAHTKSAYYYLLVFATFLFALVLNFTMAIGTWCFINRASMWTKLQELKPLLAPQLFAGLLTLVAVYLVSQLDAPGLLLFALILMIFQFLVGELLVSERRGEELRLMATTDELTGLANRKHFGDRVEQAIKECDLSGKQMAVILLDLDRFKEINDTLGHQYGDRLITQIAPRLAERVGEAGLVARFGGDEFAVLPAVQTADVRELERVAGDLIACVQEPVTIQDISLEVHSSVGIARYPADGDDAQTLLRRADIAMYAAKEHRDGFRFYDPQHDHHSTQRLSMLADFRRALLADEIVVHYHPIVDLRANRRVHGAEALVRWQHPELGLLQPGAFLQIVEQTGLIASLTSRVIDRSIAECARWHAEGRPLSISVNLSMRNLLDPQLPREVGLMLSRHGLPASALRLEITESMILSDPDRALSTVNSLAELGVRLAVDDFGTGYSSLANLRMLPVDELKIDRSFVTPMLEDESDLVIVRSTIELGHALGLKVVAEGVEDYRTLARLEQLGCDMAQGHGLSVPIPAPEFEAWMQAYESEQQPDAA